MNEDVCGECGVKGIPDPEMPNVWWCPQCNRRLLAVSVFEEVGLKESLGMHGRSADCHDGLPVRESARHVAEDGSASSVDIERKQDGSSELKRGLKPTAAAPRDPSGERKRTEEMQAVRALLAAYNKLHETTYETVESGPDERGDDVIAKSPKEDEPPVRYQVTFADSDGKLRASISRGIDFSAAGTEEQLLARAAAAVQKKSLAPDHDAVLILDGAGIAIPPGTVERFVRDHRIVLEAAPFREVWWVDHAPGGVIRRIWPSV
jgi:hypothetical protein